MTKNNPTPIKGNEMTNTSKIVATSILTTICVIIVFMIMLSVALKIDIYRMEHEKVLEDQQ